VTAVLQQLARRGDVAADLPTKAVERYRLLDVHLPPGKDNEGGTA